jgi:AP-2 complex subunit alpha
MILRYVPELLAFLFFQSTDHFWQMFRLTIRATDDSVPAVLLKLMQERLEIGVSTRDERPEPPSKREISDAFSNVLVE